MQLAKHLSREMPCDAELLAGCRLSEQSLASFNIAIKIFARLTVAFHVVIMPAGPLG